MIYFIIRFIHYTKLFFNENLFKFSKSRKSVFERSLGVALNKRKSVFNVFVRNVGSVIGYPFKRNGLFGISRKFKRKKFISDLIFIAVLSFLANHLIGLSGNGSLNSLSARFEGFFDVGLGR